MKKLLFALVTLFPVVVWAANGAMKGEGSEADPWQIADYEDLKAIGTGPYLYSNHYVLTQDIDASASKHEMCDADSSCNGFISIGKKKDAADSTVFHGSFDGKNHTIKNLNIWLPCESNVGFISYLAGSLSNLKFDSLNITGRVSESDYVGVVARAFGPIKNVHVTNGFVQGDYYVGGIVGDLDNPYGYTDNGSLDSVSFQGTVRGRRYVGGIAGFATTPISYSKANVHVIVAGKSPEYIGGIAGYLSGTIGYCSATGMITEEESVENILADYVGGLAGQNNGYILWCFAAMDIKDVSKSLYAGESGYDTGFDDDIGGLVGFNKGYIHKSYFVGNVEGNSNVGGIAGKNKGQIKHSYSLGAVSGTENVGGIVGYSENEYASVEYSYTVTTVHGTEKAGPIVGGNGAAQVVGSYWNSDYASGSVDDFGEALTSAEMKSLVNFKGWSDQDDSSSVLCESESSPNYQMSVYECDGLDGFYMEPQEGEKCHVQHYCLSVTKIWDIDDGVNFPYLNAIPFAKVLPFAVPTAAPAWQETPVVAAREDVGYTLFGKWQNWSSLNETQDSIYHSYIIGYFDGKDTVWGTSSYMAVPNKIEIASLSELKKIGNDPGYPLVANYELMADIDGLNSNFKPIGDSVTPFVGNFNGNNHVISNLKVGEPTRDFSGLFGYVTTLGIIENLVLKNIQAEGSWYVGTLVGAANGAGIRNVVSYNGDVSGAESVGGLVGSAEICQMEKVAATGKVSGHEYVGGVVGSLYGQIEKAYSVNVVKGIEYVGGVVGYNGGSIKEVYSASYVKGRYAVKEIGYSSYGNQVPDSYFDSTLFVTSRDNGRTTEQMLEQSNYEGWDFENTWAIDEGKSYPYFKGMEPVVPGTLEDDGTICLLQGSGTAADPYLIETYNDLKVIGKYEYPADSYYKQVADISAWASWVENCNADSSVCKGFEPIANFGGTYLGNGHSIQELKINRAGEDTVGLFKSLTATAKVSNLRLDSVVVNGKKYVGGLAGVDLGADIDSVSVRAFINAQDYAGAIAGEKIGGSLEIAESEGEITAKSYAGGLFGNLKNAALENTFSMAFVTGDSVLGGLVGNSDGTTVANSTAIGKVTGNGKVGGLAGSANKSTWISAYCDSLLWHQNFTAIGDMKNSVEMVYKATYVNWDFDKVWKISEGMTYPRLMWGKGKLPLVFYHEISIMKGSGTEKDPFLVTSLEDLASIGYGPYTLSSVYRLTNDIELEFSEEPYSTGEEFYAIGVNYAHSNSFGRGYTPFAPDFEGGEFSGALHGAGHTISNMPVVSDFFDSDSYVFINVIAEDGLVDSLYFKNMYSFGSGKSGFTALNRGTIRNVRVEGLFGMQAQGVLVGGEMAAGIATVNVGTISDCYVEGSVGANHVAGGIAAENWGVIANCTTSVEIVGNIYAGGLVGVDRGTIKNSRASGTAKSLGIVGGAVGYSEGSSIDSVVADVQVELIGSPFANDSAGGFIGKNNGHISNSVALGEVSNGCGFAGTNESAGVIGGSYAAGAVSDGSGFVGINKGTIRNSYTSSDVKIVNSYERYFGGFAGQNIGDGKITDVYSTGSVSFENGFRLPLFEYSVNTLVGDQSATIENAYSIGFVEVDNQSVCSLKNWSKSGTNVYFNSDKCSVPDSVSGLVLLSDDQMHHARNFKNFNFGKNWTIDEGKSYPILLFGLDSAMANDTTIAKDTTESKDSTGAKTSVAGVPAVAGSMLKAVVNGNFAELQFRTTVDGYVKFSLMDMQGRVVAERSFGNLAAGTHMQTLDMANLRNGGYIGVLHVNNRAVERTRLVKR